MFKLEMSSLFLLAVILGFALIVGGNLPYIVFYIIFTSMLLSFIGCFYVYRRLTGYQEYTKRDYYAGEDIEIRSVVDNETFFPAPFIEISDETMHLGEEDTRSAVLFLKPMGGRTVSRNYKSKYRGLYRLGPLNVKVSDMLGIYEFERNIYSNEWFKIYPRVIDISSFRLKSMQSFGTFSTKQRAHEDNTSVSDIKKYVVGENTKKIHWKVSARRGELFVKNYEMTGSAETYMFLDFFHNSFRGEFERDLEETAVETAAALISYMLKRAISINLYVNSSKPFYSKGRDIKKFREFLDILCEAKTDGSIRISSIIEKRIRLISRGASLIIITGSVCNGDVGIYSAVRHMGYEIILIFVSDQKMDSNIYTMLLNAGLVFYFMDSRADIREVLEGV